MKNKRFEQLEDGHADLTSTTKKTMAQSFFGFKRKLEIPGSEAAPDEKPKPPELPTPPLSFESPTPSPVTPPPIAEPFDPDSDRRQGSRRDLPPPNRSDDRRTEEDRRKDQAKSLELARKMPQILHQTRKAEANERLNAAYLRAGIGVAYILVGLSFLLHSRAAAFLFRPSFLLFSLCIAVVWYILNKQSR